MATLSEIYSGRQLMRYSSNRLCEYLGQLCKSLPVNFMPFLSRYSINLRLKISSSAPHAMLSILRPAVDMFYFRATTVDHLSSPCFMIHLLTSHSSFVHETFFLIKRSQRYHTRSAWRRYISLQHRIFRSSKHVHHITADVGKI